MNMRQYQSSTDMSLNHNKRAHQSVELGETLRYPYQYKSAIFVHTDDICSLSVIFKSQKADDGAKLNGLRSELTLSSVVVRGLHHELFEETTKQEAHQLVVQAKRSTTKIQIIAVGGGNFGCFLNFGKCRLEIAADVISVSVV